MKSKILSSKTYVCTLCGKERIGNVDVKKDIICWVCVQKLLNTNPEKLKKIYNILIEKGFITKAEMIEKFLPEEEVTYEEFKRPMDGRRTHKQVAFTKSER